MRCIGGPMDGREGPGPVARYLDMPVYGERPGVEWLDPLTMTFPAGGGIDDLDGEPLVWYERHRYEHTDGEWRYIGEV